MLQIEPIHFSKNNTLGIKYEKIAETFNRNQEDIRELIKDFHV